MKRKVDFTVKGTKLPMIPKGTKYKTFLYKKWSEISQNHVFLNSLVSCGKSDVEDCVSADWIIESNNPYVFQLSTIEALAEEQDVLWVEDESQKSQPSIEQLLIDCITLNNYIKRGERLFDFDERYKLKLLQDSQSKLASKVAELNNILNNN
jgi:hypothetical protein